MYAWSILCQNKAQAVKVLRKGGKFAESKVSFYAGKTLWIYTIALLVLIALSLVLHPIVGLLAGFYILYSAKSVSRKWKQWWKGQAGEKAVIEALSALSDEYILINDLTLPSNRGNIDHFLVGPNGLFVLETKNYSGETECWEDEWLVNGRGIKSLSKQAKANAVAVRTSLAKLLPNSEKQRRWFVVAILIFVNKQASLKLHRPTVTVTRLNDLANFVLNYPRRISLSPQERKEIVYHLLSEHAVASQI